MPDLVYNSMPFRSFPAHWAPHIKQLLEDIAALLTPAQRAGFRLSELRELHGELVLSWSMVGAGNVLDDRIDEQIEQLIEEATTRLQAIRAVGAREYGSPVFGQRGAGR